MGDFLSLSIALAAILVSGTFACFPFYKWQWRSFVRSSLFVKCMMWLPIYAILAVVAYGPMVVGYLFITVLIFVAITEFKLATKQHASFAAWIYLVAFIGMGSMFSWLFSAAPTAYTGIIIAVSVSSAMSDVIAFFMGKFIGKHPLPKSINENKKWEGVAGQVIGGVIGMIIVIVTFGGPFTWLFGVLIGIASAAGDIANSVAKRSLHIKDWASTIPGHGGVLDRCSSLFAAFAATSGVLMVATFIS